MAEGTTTKPSMAGDRRTIVVINDDPVQLHLLSRVLEAADFQVWAHLEPSKALQRLEARPHVDAVVIDLHMPDIDGWKVVRLLRSPEFEAYNETPILVVSATFTGADVEAITADIGADAFLAVPFSRDELLEHISGLMDGARPKRKPQALIVEDNDGVAALLGRVFSAHGYDTHRTRSLAEARRAWLDATPDLVLLDYHLPDGPGPSLLENLRAPSDQTVVIVMTGDTDPALPVQLLQMGADGYVRKPFDPTFIVELAGKARRERSLLRVEALLERRTQELRTSESWYRTLFDAIPDFVITLDASNRIVAANDSAVRLLGPGLADVEGRRINRFLPQSHSVAFLEALANVRQRGSGQFETTLAVRDGQTMLVEVTATAPEGSDGGSVLIVARDLTERRRAENEQRRLDSQVQHTQRLESLGVLAGGIAHDFNNLLVGVMGNASLALLDTAEDTPLHECISQIETAARRAAELTQQILAFAGKGESRREPQDLSAVVSEMGQLLAPAVSKKAKLTYRLAEDLPAVQADASQIRQVVMNLIMNASDALGDDSGHIDVGTSVCDVGPTDTLGFYLGDRASPGRYVALEVSDDGCGMDQETQRQIFDPFFTTKFTGRGLGLAATLGIVRAHDGLLSVLSEVGSGTTFRVLLPALRVRSDPTDEPAKPRREPKGNASGTVLVVDDEPSVRMLACNALLRAGYGVEEAGDGVSALAVLERESDIDVVLLDLTMPGMSGMEVLSALRERRPRLPVLLSSGYTDEALPEDTLQAGRTVFLSKPYAPSELVQGIADLMAGARDHLRLHRGPGGTEGAKVLRASG